MLIISLILTLCLCGFSVLFAIMDPVPWEVKLVFHIFGLATFITGLLTVVYTAQASECVNIFLKKV